MKADGKVTVTVPVTNTGKCAGTETVQVYVKALDDAGAPIKALKGFQKLSLAPGEMKKATITLDGEAFEYYNEPDPLRHLLARQRSPVLRLHCHLILYNV